MNRVHAAGLAPCPPDALTEGQVGRLERAARQGDGLAALILGERYLTAAHYAPAKAFAYYQVASAYPLALARLGDFWLHSEPEHGVCERDPVRARLAHESAAQAGHGPSALAASDAWRMGRGCPRDYEQAYFYLGLAWRYGPVVPLLALLEGSLRADLSPEALRAGQQRLQGWARRPRAAGVALQPLWWSAYRA
ncbi:MAG: hypothetical protein RLZZ174_1487 [Pseudomonadota bacterium]|jgi:hypothetical protein